MLLIWLIELFAPLFEFFFAFLFFWIVDKISPASILTLITVFFIVKLGFFILFEFIWLFFLLFATIFSLTLNTKSSTHSIYIIYFCSLVLFIPLIAAGIRRLHDTGRTGAFIFLMIVPFGIFCLLYMWSIDSEERSNEYGPSPKYILPNIPSQQPINPYPQQNMPSVYPYQNNPIPPQGYTVDPNVPNNVYAQPAYIPPQTGGYQQPYPWK